MEMGKRAGKPNLRPPLSSRERGECVHSEQGLIVHLGGRSFEENGRAGGDDACSSSADLCGARRGDGCIGAPIWQTATVKRRQSGGFTISYSELQVERRLARGAAYLLLSSTWLLVFTQRRQQTSSGVNSISRGERLISDTDRESGGVQPVK